MKLPTKIVAFEGMPGAGKTAAIKMIYKRNLLDNTVIFPQLEITKHPQKLQANLSTSKAYLYAELGKTKSIERLIKRYDHILLDRSYLSTLAYCYASSKLFGNISEFVELEQYYETLNMQKKLYCLDLVFVFITSITVSISRRVKEFDTLWFNREFLRHFREFYLRKIKEMNGIGKIVIVNAEKLSLDKIVEFVTGVL